MTVLQAFILGCIQGLTEFLPISSSAHLAIFQSLMGIRQSNIVFDVFVHMATLIAVICFFWKDILKLRVKDYMLLIVATIPAVLVGLFLKDQISSLFRNTIYIGFELILTGFINFAIDYKIKHAPTNNTKELTEVEDIPAQRSFIIGIFQAIAISPGISRSGATVLGGMFNGLSRELAFKFSFLMAIPAIIGAGVLEMITVIDNPSLELSWPIMIAGGLAAFLTGLLSLKVFKYVINHAKLSVFGWYCIVFGVITIFFIR